MSEVYNSAEVSDVGGVTETTAATPIDAILERGAADVTASPQINRKARTRSNGSIVNCGRCLLERFIRSASAARRWTRRQGAAGGTQPIR